MVKLSVEYAGQVHQKLLTPAYALVELHRQGTVFGRSQKSAPKAMPLMHEVPTGPTNSCYETLCTLRGVSTFET